VNPTGAVSTAINADHGAFNLVTKDATGHAQTAELYANRNATLI
jgi:hypothetical protein